MTHNLPGYRGALLRTTTPGKCSALTEKWPGRLKLEMVPYGVPESATLGCASPVGPVPPLAPGHGTKARGRMCGSFMEWPKAVV